MNHRSVLLCAAALAACSNAETRNPMGTMPGRGGGTASGPDLLVLVLNEVSPSSDREWFELYNPSAVDVPLDGATFTDDIAGRPARAQFTSAHVVPAGGYFVLYLDDPDPGFGLASDEELGIFAPDGTEIDSVDWDEGAVPEGGTYGRWPDATGAFVALGTPTPGAANIEASSCGNGALDGAEPCDGAMLGAATCESEGFVSGTLRCNSTCTGFDTRACMSAAGAVINEVESTGDDRIELFNPTSNPVDLTGWYVTDDGYDPNDDATADHRYDLSGMLAAGGFRVLVKGTNHAFGIGGADSIHLFDANGAIADETTWVDGEADPSWCRDPDGTGAFATCGAATFGASNSATPVPMVVLNEVESSGDDRIEIFNPVTVAADLTGWYVVDSGYDPNDPMTADARYDFPAGTKIEGEAYLVLVKGTDHGFGLGGSGDVVTLYDASGAIVDSASWGDGEADVSFCRLPNGSGTFVACGAATFGAENRAGPPPAANLVINEVTSAGDDLIELYNAGTAAATLDGWYVTDDGYDPMDPMMTADHRYDFAVGTSVEPGAYVVLTKGVEHGFGIGGADAISLYDDTDTVVDTTSWASGEADPSWCRMPNGDGAFGVCAAATFGAENL